MHWCNSVDWYYLPSSSPSHWLYISVDFWSAFVCISQLLVVNGCAQAGLFLVPHCSSVIQFRLVVQIKINTFIADTYFVVL